MQVKHVFHTSTCFVVFQKLRFTCMGIHFSWLSFSLVFCCSCFLEGTSEVAVLLAWELNSSWKMSSHVGKTQFCMKIFEKCVKIGTKGCRNACTPTPPPTQMKRLYKIKQNYEKEIPKINPKMTPRIWNKTL